jgi:hypothetical protein
MRERSRRDFEGLVNEKPSIVTHSIRSGDRSTASPISKGARFRMSVLGAARNPRLAEKEGTIVGSSRLNSSLRVLFDGRKSPMSLHRDYIEQIAPEAN